MCGKRAAVELRCGSNPRWACARWSGASEDRNAPAAAVTARVWASPSSAAAAAEAGATLQTRDPASATIPRDASPTGTNSFFIHYLP